MTDRETNTFGVRAVEVACQMAGVGTDESSVPQVLHPMLGDAPVEGQEDTRVLWVKLTDVEKDFGPESWMWCAFRYMLPLFASDADFRLFSMEERIPVELLFNQSLDVREDPAFSRLQRLLFTFSGTDVTQPANLKGTVRRVRNIAGLLRAIDDVQKNGAGPVSWRCPSDIRATKDAENSVQYIFAIAFHSWRVSPSYCLGLRAADMSRQTDKCWANLMPTLRDAFVMVPNCKMAYEFLAQFSLMMPQFGTYTFEMLDISQDERVLNLVPSMAEELRRHERSVLQLDMRPRSTPWQQLMEFLCSDKVLLVGYDCENSRTLLHDTLGIGCIDRPEQCRYLTKDPEEHRLFHQFQLVDFEKVLKPTHLRAVAGYDSENPDPMNLPEKLELEV